jgi:hypothetical protein
MPNQWPFDRRGNTLLGLSVAAIMSIGALSLFATKTSTPTTEIQRGSVSAPMVPTIIKASDAFNGAHLHSSRISIAANFSWPTRVSRNGRVFLDQNGKPWLGVGDTAWSLIGQLTDYEIAAYFDDRAAKGVNLVLLNAPEPYYADKAPNNINNTPAFTGTAFQSQLNQSYWRRVDYAVNYAASKGITLLICPMYIGYSGDGWETQLLTATEAQMANYGHYLAERYASAKNIMWVLGHDKPNISRALKDRGKALADSLKAGTRHLVGIASHRSRDGGTFGIGSEEWANSGVVYDFDTQYDYSGTPGKNAAVIWSLTPARPFIFFEGIYEQDLPGPLPIGDKVLREQLWGPFVNGASGVFFGNSPVWGFGTRRLGTPYIGTWQQNLDYSGSRYLGKFAEITAAIGSEWGNTLQDSESTFVYDQGKGARRVSARYSNNLGLIYHPNFSPNTILTVNLAKFAATWKNSAIERYDPASGAVVSVGTYPTSEKLTLNAPGINSRGDRDWLFVVRGVID